MTSPHLQINDGDKTLSLRQGQTATLKLRLTMTPPPKDFPELKVFRIVLVSTDGNVEIQEAKRAKVTSNARSYRDISIKVSSELFEEGTYYFRAYGEDEAGNILNKEDDFRDPEVQEAWQARRREDGEANHAGFKAETSAKTVNETERQKISHLPARNNIRTEYTTGLRYRLISLPPPLPIFVK